MSVTDNVSVDVLQACAQWSRFFFTGFRLNDVIRQSIKAYGQKYDCLVGKKAIKLCKCCHDSAINLVLFYIFWSLFSWQARKMQLFHCFCGNGILHTQSIEYSESHIAWLHCRPRIKCQSNQNVALILHIVFDWQPKWSDFLLQSRRKSILAPSLFNRKTTQKAKHMKSFLFLRSTGWQCGKKQRKRKKTTTTVTQKHRYHK